MQMGGEFVRLEQAVVAATAKAGASEERAHAAEGEKAQLRR
jgi:hypothetical protein